MRVLHLVSVATMTGPADPALALARAQRELFGWDVSIAYDTVREGDMPRRVKEHGVPPVEELGLCTKGGVLRAFSDRRRLARLAAELDVIHAHSTHDHGIASLSLASPDVRLVRSFHHPRSLKRRPFQRVALERTDGFVLLNRTHQAQLLAAYPGLDPERMAIVPGATDPERYHPSKSGAAIRAELQLPPEAFVAGMIARFQPGRDQPLFIRAMAEARAATGLDLWLALIGKGETQAELEAAIEAHGLTGRARLYGFRDADLPEAIRSCDVTVLLKEGSDASCRAVLQSLSCEVPVIGARFPAIIEALEDGAGRLVDPGDLAGLTAALIELARLTDAERRELGRLGRERVLERYTERARAENVAVLYERIRQRTAARA